MTREEIIEKFKENAEKYPNHWGEICWVFCVDDFEDIVDELLAEIEQGKKEVAKEILKSLYDEAISQQGEVVELTAYYIKNTLAKEYGVELWEK